MKLKKPLTELIRERRQKSPAPKWSGRVLFAATIFFACCAAGIAFVNGDRPLWLNLEVVTVGTGMFLCLLYFVILYCGIRINSGERWDIRRRTPPNGDIDFEGLPELVELGAQLLTSAVELGPVGAAISIISAILCFVIALVGAAFLIEFLLFLGLTIAEVSAFLLFAPLYWVFRTSLRFVMRHTLACRGSISRSLFWALWYAAVKACLIGAFIYGSHLIHTTLFPHGLLSQ